LVLRHPLTLVGVLASCYLLWSFNRDVLLPHLGAYSTYVGLGLAPLAGAGLLVGHLVASRAHRHDTLEIEETAPAVQRSRILGRLVGVLVTVPIAVVVVVAYVVYVYLQGAAGTPAVRELLVGPLVVGLATIAGVAMGTWLPNRFSGFLALGALAGIQIAFQDAEGTRHWLAWWHTVLWYGAPDLWVRPTGAHLAYLAGIALMVAGVAMLRHGVRPMPLMAVATGVALALAGGIVQARPPSDARTDELLARVTDPASHWVTIERPSVTYRVHPGYERWIDSWDAAVQRVLAPLPPSARPVLEVEQWHPPYLSQLEEELGYSTPEGQAVQERGGEVSAPRAIAAEGNLDGAWPIQVGTSAYIGQHARLAIAAATRAVGLPLLPVETQGRPYTEEEIASFNRTGEDLAEGGVEWWPGRELGEPAPVAGDRIPLSLACDAEGQAREVVAAWLAATASPDLAATYADIRAHGPGYGNAFGEDPIVMYSPDNDTTLQVVMWSSLGWRQGGGYGDVGESWSVLASPTATDLAAQLLELPQEDVATAVAVRWGEWTDPATRVQAIIRAFGLEAPPRPEQWLLRAGLDPGDFAASVAAYPHTPGEVETLDQRYPVCS